MISSSKELWWLKKPPTIPAYIIQRPQFITGYLCYYLSKQFLKQQLSHELKKDRSHVNEWPSTSYRYIHRVNDFVTHSCPTLCATLRVTARKLGTKWQWRGTTFPLPRNPSPCLFTRLLFCKMVCRYRTSLHSWKVVLSYIQLSSDGNISSSTLAVLVLALEAIFKQLFIT